MLTFKFFDIVSIAAVISLATSNLQNQYQDVQLELLQHHINFHPDQLKRVRELKPRGFACTDLVTPGKVKVTESVIKW